MSVIVAIAAWSIYAFGGLLLLAQMLAREIGYLLGRRAGPRPEREGVGVLVGAILGLLAFVLALTLSFSNTRFIERRQGTLVEANAIGTAWLRAKAIDHPRAAEIARQIETYTTLRADFVRASHEEAAIEAMNTHSAALQTEIWGHLAALVRDRADPVVASLMASLNEAFDAATAVRFAFSFTMPVGLFVLLIGMALISMMALGFQLGLRGNPHRILATLLTLTWTLVIVEILDLGAGRLGGIRTSAAVYDWTLEGFRGGVPISSLPSR
jgi:hypothetical protein